MSDDELGNNEESKQPNKYTTITVDRKTFEMLEQLKFLTFSPSFSRMFEKLEPILMEAGAKWFTTVGDAAFKGAKVKPFKIETELDLTTKLGTRAATE